MTEDSPSNPPDPRPEEEAVSKEVDPEQEAIPAGDAISEEAAEALATFEAAERAKANPPATARTAGLFRGFFTGFFVIRDEPTWAGKLLMAGLFLVMVVALWIYVTWGDTPESRIVSPTALGSPKEVLDSFHSLWFDRALMRNLIASLWRVLQGFGLAALVGVPIGILCGAFRRIDAFFLPVSVFGRNVPIVALLPMVMLWFGTGEALKVGFLFIACVAFIMFDSATNIQAVSDNYLDTAYTLGASRWQVLRKVVIPLAMPDIVNSLRLLLGLAFGYIILAEMVDMDTGVGKLIMMSQRRGPKEHVYLILLFITLVAFLLDRLIYLLQQHLFPYRFARK
jgi:ABC-type nitrate/sulfonate/bicarbonate transport system permease component